jgi:hypothetical protein
MPAHYRRNPVDYRIRFEDYRFSLGKSPTVRNYLQTPIEGVECRESQGKSGFLAGFQNLSGPRGRRFKSFRPD